MDVIRPPHTVAMALRIVGNADMLMVPRHAYLGAPLPAYFDKACSLATDFNPTVFTAMTRYVCFLPASAWVSV